MDALRRNIFLVDGLGAVVSTLATVGIWLGLQSWVGLPSQTLLLLIILAAAFALYSLSCWAAGARLVPWLPIVMAANVGYCILTAAMLVLHADVVRPLGWAYFGGEIVVVLAVVTFERSVLRRATAPA